MNAFYDAKGVHGVKKIQYAVMLLEGHARIWWKSQVQNRTQATTWKEFQTAITTQFKKIDENRRARKNLERLTQTTSVEKYIAEFTNLIYQITDIHETEKFHRFFSGLKIHVQNEMIKQDITSDLLKLQMAA